MFAIIISLSIVLITCDAHSMKKYEGDFIIGALLSLHGPGDPESLLPSCGKIQTIDGIQKLEAALLALEMINNDTKILPGVTLGMTVYDTCWSESIALRQSLYLIGGANIVNDEDERMGQGKLCNKSSLIGIIGPPSSQETAQVQNLFELFNIPQIGRFYMRSQSHEEIKSSTVLQILPCSTCQSKVVQNILKEFNWTYVATVHTTGDFGEAIINSFRNLVYPECSNSGICIGKDLEIKLYANETEADAIIREIDEDKLINVVICFCERQGLRYLFEATKRLNLTNRFTFIASDGWGSVRMAVDGLEEQAWGTIYLQFDAPEIPIFSKYYTSLKPSSNTRNPWFAEFWEHKFQCTLPKNRSSVNTDSANRKSGRSTPRPLCKGDENLAENYHEHRKNGFMMRSMWAMAHGLHNMMTEVCGLDYNGVCSKMYPFNTKKLMNHLRKLSFRYGNELVTVQNEDPVSSYIIMNYRKMIDNSFKFVKIGDWTNETLKLYQEFQSKEHKSIFSRCSLPCPLGWKKIFTRENKNQGCCWECEPCGNYEYLSWNKEQCVECPYGEWSNANRTGCEKIPILVSHWNEPTTIMIITFTVTGSIATLFTFYTFMKYKDTPVVKSSSRELCYVILFSMILSHISVFVILERPSIFRCAYSRSVPLISMTMMYASVFIKTHRIARILVHTKNRFPKKKYRLMSTSSQVAIVFLCVALATALSSATLIYSPPILVLILQSPDLPAWICHVSVENMIPSTVFMLLPYGLCILYAIKTRNVPENFNEAKFIGFSVLISSIIFLISITIICVETRFRAQVAAFGMSLNSSITLVFLFFPKLYIIIYKPEKNNRALFITNKNIRIHIGPAVDANVVESSLVSPMNLVPESSAVIPEPSSRLRRSVATQTSTM